MAHASFQPGTIDGVAFNLTVSELKEFLLIAHSGTPGGDGNALTLDLAFGAMHDIGIKYNLKKDGIKIIEKPDKIPPSITGAGTESYKWDFESFCK